MWLPKVSELSVHSTAKPSIWGGGVANNRSLRRLFTAKISIPLFFPPPDLSTDNAAMIAGLGYVLYSRGITSDPLHLDVFPKMHLPNS